MRMDEHTVLVIGGTHGLGRDLARHYAETGRRVVGLAGEDVRITLVKDGDHRLSRDQDIALLCRTAGDLLDETRAISAA